MQVTQPDPQDWRKRPRRSAESDVDCLWQDGELIEFEPTDFEEEE